MTNVPVPPAASLRAAGLAVTSDSAWLASSVPRIQSAASAAQNDEEGASTTGAKGKRKDSDCDRAAAVASRWPTKDFDCDRTAAVASHWPTHPLIASDATVVASSAPPFQSSVSEAAETVASEPVALAVSPWVGKPAVTSDWVSRASSEPSTQSPALGDDVTDGSDAGEEVTYGALAATSRWIVDPTKTSSWTKGGTPSPCMQSATAAMASQPLSQSKDIAHARDTGMEDKQKELPTTPDIASVVSPRDVQEEVDQRLSDAEVNISVEKARITLSNTLFASANTLAAKHWLPLLHAAAFEVDTDKEELAREAASITATVASVRAACDVADAAVAAALTRRASSLLDGGSNRRIPVDVKHQPLFTQPAGGADGSGDDDTSQRTPRSSPEPSDPAGTGYTTPPRLGSELPTRLASAELPGRTANPRQMLEEEVFAAWTESGDNAANFLMSNGPLPTSETWPCSPSPVAPEQSTEESHIALAAVVVVAAMSTERAEGELSGSVGEALRRQVAPATTSNGASDASSSIRCQSFAETSVSKDSPDTFRSEYVMQVAPPLSSAEAARGDMRTSIDVDEEREHVSALHQAEKEDTFQLAKRMPPCVARSRARSDQEWYNLGHIAGHALDTRRLIAAMCAFDTAASRGRERRRLEREQAAHKAEECIRIHKVAREVARADILRTFLGLWQDFREDMGNERQVRYRSLSSATRTSIRRLARSPGLVSSGIDGGGAGGLLLDKCFPLYSAIQQVISRKSGGDEGDDRLGGDGLSLHSHLQLSAIQPTSGGVGGVAGGSNASMMAPKSTSATSRSRRIIARDDYDINPISVVRGVSSGREVVSLDDGLKLGTLNPKP